MQTRVGSSDPFEDEGAGLGSPCCSRAQPRSSAPGSVVPAWAHPRGRRQVAFQRIKPARAVGPRGRPGGAGCSKTHPSPPASWLSTDARGAEGGAWGGVSTSGHTHTPAHAHGVPLYSPAPSLQGGQGSHRRRPERRVSGVFRLVCPSLASDMMINGEDSVLGPCRSPSSSGDV